MQASLSPSRANDFMQCPLLYRFRVIDKLPEPPSPAAARGTLVHAALERVFDVPAAERTPEHAVGLLPGEWERMLAEDPELATLLSDGTPASDDATDGDLPDTAAWLAKARDLVEKWFTLEDPTRLEPAEREMRVETEVDGLTLRGIVDRLDVAPDGRMRIVDYKTGRAPSERFEGKALFQMKFYALVLWRLRERIPTLVQVVYLGDGRTLQYAPDEQDLLATERKVLALWEAIDRARASGDWKPSPSRLCDWCAHQAICPAFGGTPPAPPVQERENTDGDEPGSAPASTS